MGKYLFIFKRQQVQLLLISVAIAFGGVIFTALCTMLLYALFISNRTENQAMFTSVSMFAFIVPCGVMYCRKRICQKFNSIVLFLLLATAMSFPMVWIIARNTINVVVFGCILALVIFMLSLWWGMRVARFLHFRGLCYIMFTCVAVSSLIEAFFGVFNQEHLKLHVTFCLITLIFGLYNVHDVLRFREELPEFAGTEQQQIRQNIIETAIQLYLNFIGMLFIVDFMKFLVKVFAEQPSQKSAS